MNEENNNKEVNFKDQQKMIAALNHYSTRCTQTAEDANPVIILGKIELNRGNIEIYHKIKRAMHDIFKAEFDRIHELFRKI